MKYTKITYVLVGVIFASAILASLIVDFTTMPVYARTKNFHVVIDAGHGGFDGGAVSRNGISEKDINLAISRQLAREFENHGVGVTMTRTNEYSLANPYARDKKRSDMEERKKIIKNVAPDLVISIHLNSFPSIPSVRGLQTFYNGDSEQSRTYAAAIQTKFNESNLLIKRNPAMGNYFILECTNYPSVLVECGFLSNPSEEKLLQNTEYQKMLATMIAEAIINC